MLIKMHKISNQYRRENGCVTSAYPTRRHKFADQQSNCQWKRKRRHKGAIIVESIPYILSSSSSGTCRPRPPARPPDGKARAAAHMHKSTPRHRHPRSPSPSDSVPIKISLAPAFGGALIKPKGTDCCSILHSSPTHRPPTAAAPGPTWNAD